ncbi:GM10091 [Drosophila sechellia]|uniref:GM10091 n=1 Tax=Drosophila sechellia TaxID=7238 RepID=B4IN53_DROSE|nr:GM10091 [Drosophila sechellia]
MPANLFRAKVTPPIKGASGAAGGAAVIGAAGATGIGGTGAGPQILGNIKLTSSSGGAATIKQVPSSALRNIKICSPNGKLFLQPGKLPAGSIIHKFNNASSTAVSAAGGVVTTTTTTVSPTKQPAREQRISIQKILQPATGSASSGSSSPTTTTTTISGLTSSAKQPVLGSKPTTLTFATAGGGKNNLVFLPASAASGMRALTLATKPKSNVLPMTWRPKACEENAKLAAPAETAVYFGEALVEQASLMSLKYSRGARTQDTAMVIMSEPFKVPDLPNEVKKMTQKRKENDSGMDGKPNKKRHMQQPHPQQPHLPASQQQQSQQLNPLSNPGMEEADPVPPEKRLTARTLQQRYFYQQQMKHKQRLTSKRNLANRLGSPSAQSGSPLGGRNMPSSGIDTSTAKRSAAPAKSGRRAQKQLQQQQQQKLQQHQQQKVLMQSQETVPNHMVVQPHVEYPLLHTPS